MRETPKKYANGCLWLIVVALISSITFAITTILLDNSPFIVFFLSLAIAVFIALKIVGKPKLTSIIVNLVISTLFLGLIALGITFVYGLLTPRADNAVFSEEEAIEKTMIIEGVDTIQVYSTYRVWKDNYGNDYNTTLTVRDSDYQKLKNNISKYGPNSRANFWGNLYDYIERTDRVGLDLILKAFETIQNEKNLNQMEFAEMVVSCIQDIPYSYVFQEACLPADQYEYTIRTLLEQCPDCCIGNIAYGIQNPVSFMQNLKGDCDTRTVMIYSVLKYFDYDVAILNSDFYKHSILGINLPSRGSSKIYNGKRYMLWETTAKYFEVGNLPTTYDDTSYWNVVLTSK